LLTEFRATVGDETTDKSFQHPMGVDRQ
jgi:hypothetical protein